MYNDLLFFQLVPMDIINLIALNLVPCHIMDPFAQANVNAMRLSVTMWMVAKPTPQVMDVI